MRKHWHAWAFWTPEDGYGDGFMRWAEPSRPQTRPTVKGKWVRVRFVEYKPQTRKRPSKERT